MSNTRHHTEWLNLLDVSGPFLAITPLMRVFPQGLDVLEPEVRRRLKQAYDEWSEEGGRDPALHTLWIRFVLHEVLGLDSDMLKGSQQIASSLTIRLLHQPGVLHPDYAVVNPPWYEEPGTPRLLVISLPPSTRLDAIIKGTSWSHEGRLTELLKATGVSLGLLTNGERWVLIHRLPDIPPGQVAFQSTLWVEEPLTLRAFVSLLGRRRMFDDEAQNTLESLLIESQKDQQDVTDQLGRQVRLAVELLVQAIDHIDQDRGRSLLPGVSERQLYLAATRVMMRLIFLLAGEERGLIGDLRSETWQTCYAISALRDQLREVADRHGEEILERRFDAWCRLLATFRAVHGGVHHHDFSLPAFLGSLFDPDEFPFLEGRTPDTSWHEPASGPAAAPLAIHNRTVLHLLEALQFLEIRAAGAGTAESRRLSFRGLGPEQIGHVYEGLLDHTAVRASEVVLGLVGTSKQEREVALSTLEAQRAKGEDTLVKWLAEYTDRGEPAIKKLLGAQPRRGVQGVDPTRWLALCGHDPTLWQRLQPFAPLVRLDKVGWPVLFLPGSLYVTEGTDRRTSGTHYTPREITEPVVRFTLEPLVYHGPGEGLPPEQWRLKSPRELLSLKICDPAMGSGAFLVQACRYLAARLCEAWQLEEVGQPGQELPPRRLRVVPEGLEARGEHHEQLVPEDPDERLLVAKRVVAERCLYGVDQNTTATEIGKLSLWLETLSRQPFTFLDHALRSGDSLLGLTHPDQIRWFHLNPRVDSQVVFGEESYRKALARARDARQRLESFAVVGPEEYAAKQLLRKEASLALEDATTVADLILGATLSMVGRPDDVVNLALGRLALWARGVMESEPTSPEGIKLRDQLAEEARQLLGESPAGIPRHPFHWPLEFPEVFAGDGGGFDAIVGNPPFQGGQKITGNLGVDYRDHLIFHLAGGTRGSADLCAYFFLRAQHLLKKGGIFGLIATNTIAQGDTREVGLDQVITRDATLIRAYASRKWPGQAHLEIAQVWACVGRWGGTCVLEDVEVPAISAFLTRPGKVMGKPYRLKANEGKSFQGSIVLGMGFVMSPEDAQVLITRDPHNRQVLFPYLNGEDLNSRWDQSPSRWVINFKDWPLDRTAVGSWVTASEEQRKLWRRSGHVPADYPNPVAEDYPDCIAIVKEKVKPERDRLAGGDTTAQDRARRWWQFARPTLNLYATIEGMERVILIALSSKTLSASLVPTGVVVDQTAVTISPYSSTTLGVMVSSPHYWWAITYGASLRSDPRYTPTDCFETFPFPIDVSDLESIGTRYHDHRQWIMTTRREGLTRTYNRFHQPEEKAADIAELQRLHRELDEGLARAYGWEDLIPRLRHGFYATRQGIRYTLCETARQEVLERLLALNHQRFAEEQAAEEAEKQARKVVPPPRKARATPQDPSRSLQLKLL